VEVFRCDGCGREMKRGDLRYKVAIDVRAAYDTLEIGLADLVRDHRAELMALLERAGDKNPSDIEATVYKHFKLDLCPACQRAYILDPLRFHPEQGNEPPVDIDAFLRSLGISGDGGGGED